MYTFLFLEIRQPVLDQCNRRCSFLRGSVDDEFAAICRDIVINVVIFLERIDSEQRTRCAYVELRTHAGNRNCHQRVVRSHVEKLFTIPTPSWLSPP